MLEMLCLPLNKQQLTSRTAFAFTCMVVRITDVEVHVIERTIFSVIAN